MAAFSAHPGWAGNSCDRRSIGHTIAAPKKRVRRTMTPAIAAGRLSNREETDMRRIAGLAAMTAVALALAAGAANADTKDKKIAFSNNYAGNSWRQAMLKSYDAVTKKAVADGVVAAADVFTTTENQVTEQAAQIQNLILQGYDAIVINAASPDALNGPIKQACDAGIIVVSFDGIVTEPCAWRVVVDFKDMGEKEVDFVASRLKG